MAHHIIANDFIKAYCEDDLTYEQMCELFGIKRNQIAIIARQLGVLNKKPKGRKRAIKVVN